MLNDAPPPVLGGLGGKRGGEVDREKMSPVLDIFMRIRTHHYLSLLSGGHSQFLSVSIIGEGNGSTKGGGVVQKWWRSKRGEVQKGVGVKEKKVWVKKVIQKNIFWIFKKIDIVIETFA